MLQVRELKHTEFLKSCPRPHRIIFKIIVFSPLCQLTWRDFHNTVQYENLNI